jgi:Wadjet protein JetD, C-terminal
MPDKASFSDAAKPVWLSEQPGIERLLHSVIDKLNKKPDSKPGFTLNEKTLPELYQQADTVDLTWSLLQSLFGESYQVFRFKENKKRNLLDPEFANGRINFNPQSEKMMRAWLNRPAVESEQQKWKRQVANFADKFPGDVDRLSARNISVTGKTVEDILEGFLKMQQFSSGKLTLRNISAQCFWQDSKFLDNREEIVASLYPQLMLRARAVLVNVYLPENIKGVLFIENQDSYNQAIQGIPKAADNLALVYSAGFKLSAQRIRQLDGVSLHFHYLSKECIKPQFFEWWHEAVSKKIEQDWSVFFWGDLDFSGMDILANLKQRFSTVQAWQPGYQPMLEMLLNGEGHEPEATGKQGQKIITKTGCDFADKKLLPVLLEINRFVDQETICV